jgi:hypothetical protein
MFEFTPENYFIALAIADSDYYSVENFPNKTFFEIEFHRYLPNPNIDLTSDVMIEDSWPAVKCSENAMLENITDVKFNDAKILDFKFHKARVISVPLP